MYATFKGYFALISLIMGAISNIKPALELSDTVLLRETFKFDIMLKFKLRERC